MLPHSPAVGLTIDCVAVAVAHELVRH